MFYYNGKKINRIGFLGLGKSNLGIYDYLSCHYDLKVTLRSSSPVDTSAINAERVYLGKNMLSDIDEDILFISPSARRDTPLLEAARERGVILSSDSELFFANTKSDIFAVTGSDGKSTTSYLTSRLLSSSYSSAVACGNIGEAMTPHLDDPIDTAYVTELSSFQLMYLEPKCKRGVITNISENHLNWHTSYDEYINAKRKVFECCRERVLNYDCAVTRGIAGDYDIFAVFSSKLSESDLRRLINAELYITLEDGFITANGDKLLDTKRISVWGAHNTLNFMAAAAMSFGFFEKDDITCLAEGFGGLGHRCQLVGDFRGVKYYDSSIDSSPKRCAATLNSMPDKVILILGGRSKGLDFATLIPTLQKKTKEVILTGECSKELEAILRYANFTGNTISYIRIDSFYDAIKHAVRLADRGDTVLLSPAATSYDSFKNFEERGDAFAKAIKRFENERT